jgi:hypothetical protein
MTRNSALGRCSETKVPNMYNEEVEMLNTVNTCKGTHITGINVKTYYTFVYVCSCGGFSLH